MGERIYDRAECFLVFRSGVDNERIAEMKHRFLAKAKLADRRIVSSLAACAE